MTTDELIKELAAARRRLATATSELSICAATGAPCADEWERYEHAERLAQLLEQKLERTRREQAAEKA